MASLKIPIIVKISRHLAVIEMFFVVALGVGAVLMVAKIDSNVVMISLGGLTFTFFLYAYRPSMVRWAEDENPGIKELLAFTILPKVMWISTSVLTLGILLYLIPTGNNGYKQLIQIGAQTIGMSVLLMLFFLRQGVKHLNTLVPILFRTGPVLLIAIYIITI